MSNWQIILIKVTACKLSDCETLMYSLRDRAEGGAGGALPPHFFARIKINLTNNLTKVTE